MTFRLRLRPLAFALLIASLSSIALPDLSTAVQPPHASGGVEAIAPLVEEAIREGKCPGAVVLVSHQGTVIYRRAFGHRALVPEKLPMEVDTIFDLASLTKVIATTTAVMQLVEQGRIRLEDSVAEYWPEFKANGKEEITIRELMTHYSGLGPDLPLEPAWSGYDTAMRMIVEEKPIAPPGTRFIYSDINFETLGEIVRRVCGETLDAYANDHIFRPLGMKDTMFEPPASLHSRIAPTQYQNGTSGKLLWGEVHDPTSYNMGGVSGHAGLFSTADDLSIFAQMILGKGTVHEVRILSPLSVEKMTSPASPPGKTAVRGLGWDIDSPYSSNRGELFPIGSFGHTGFTGTSIWIDPASKTYVIILTNAVHPAGKGNVIALRSKIATIVAAAVGAEQEKSAATGQCPLTGYAELERSYRAPPPRNGKVQTGIDVLEAENFQPLAGLRIGLITNHSGLDSQGHRTIDLLRRATAVRLTTIVAVFSPEHGPSGRAENRVPSSTDLETGLPVFSLYGQTLRPTEKMLDGLDALVFDIQDAGVRFYTYITTLGYAMEEAAKRGMQFFVLDRPNPITGDNVEGPMLDSELISFVAYHPLPVRHGMTVGELAEMFNEEKHLGLKLHVIKMQDWRRSDWFDETAIVWVNPSPNLRSLTEATLYPGVGMIEGANVSVGRGTDTPFEVVGAPWIDAPKLAEYLNARRIQGVRFVPLAFTPMSNKFESQVCHGVNIVLLDRQALDSPELGAELASALYKLFPKDFELDKTLPLVGSRQVLEGVRNGLDPRTLALHWQVPLENFRRIRERYLLY